jgi:hypothetical protein
MRFTAFGLSNGFKVSAMRRAAAGGDSVSGKSSVMRGFSFCSGISPFGAKNP